MARPWTKKNPLMSMALSGANTWANAARGFLTAEARRNGTAAAKQVAAFWTGALLPGRKAPRRKK